MSTSIIKKHEIIQKVVCPSCDKFCGLITSDGKGPVFDECLATSDAKSAKCPMYRRLEEYQPKRSALGVGGGRSGPWDADAMGYQSVAIRAMEDNG